MVEFVVKKKEHIRLLAELGFIRAVHDMLVVDLKPSRLKGLLKRLQKQVDKEFLQSKIYVTDEDLSDVMEVIEEFNKLTKWGGKRRSIATIINFLTELSEKSKNIPKGIQRTLVEIAIHLENGGKLPPATLWAGSLAMERWETICQKL